MKGLVLIVFSSLIFVANAQVAIGTGTQMAQLNTPIITVQSNGGLINASSFDFSETELRVNLAGPVTEISGNWTPKRLRLDADPQSVIRLNGNLTITERLDLISGILLVENGKILYTGTSDNLIANGEGQSYVDGPFFQTGSGSRQFPIGTSSSYAPVRLTDVKSTGEIGIQAFDANAQLVADNVQVFGVNSERYWRITSSELPQINSSINVSIRGLSIPGDGGPTVVQGAETGSAAVNLKVGSVNDDSWTSLLPVSAPIVAVGQQLEILVKVHDLITPFKVDNVNDRLFIENIERFAIRKVTLLDRWGKTIKAWGDEYTNDIEYDFNQLSPGNYICVVEYGNEGAKTSKLSQMVTVLKTNVSTKN
jgi:hypothetical protein